ncbi:tRNA (adenosine(37)-N6)-threonylcarbamoyltransferase complex dimerization subunit type 1 TsaB [Fodinisporobacter ferrooxydans]|uniref:tRNA (Adenosine(37)-N6)-threonylcarbamoyltransferase complex dimerization subunit type 1 TsaB n=1 Tax=Fodinisporobacter ferrooxydans TaxID=2901836 RepID=A0ABY4CRZ8_9BACL|nr:tRNA (adenosine(37)-N6)-threonylcarbamoyltransferase complex dimerization subunit type 1 TsaB [Alicyclobacillaceae bacterium MYW30-H2]
MAYLALDTSTETLAIGVGDEVQLLGEATILRTNNHSIQMMPILDQLMDDCSITPQQLEGIIIGKGPGSYTGVRIGVTTAKVLAWTLNIPMIGVSSLQALAQSSRSHRGIVLAMFEARRKRVYAGAYLGSRAYEAVVPIAEIRQWLVSSFGCGNESEFPEIVCTGDGSRNYATELRQMFEDRLTEIAPLSRQHIRAANLLELGIPLLKQGKREDTANFSPEYLQLAQVEAKLLQETKEGTV